MIFKTATIGAVSSNDIIVKMRCPSCRQRGTFDTLQKQDAQIVDGEKRPYAFGQRRCPDPVCHAHVFFVYDMTAHNIVAAYPAETIDFDSSGLPSLVLQAFKEAVVCHANNCYVAAAIMVRKTLEELCRDRGAAGKNLKDKISDLRSKVILPKELMDGLDDLRLLGNDAAHIESTEYENVGSDEVEISIEITKEVLKAVYQYSALLGKLQKLKRTT